MFRSVAKASGDEEEFLRKLQVLEDTDVPVEVREPIEKEVKEAVLRFGVWIGHGDLLTVKMIQEARMSMAGSATAFDRLEFLGPFRLQLLHMKMKKTSQDYSLGMKRDINFDDVLTIAWQAAMTRTKVSNKAKDIKKNDSSFERHDQFIQAVQSNFLVNMFDNYQILCPEKLASIDCLEKVIAFILEMLDSYDICLFYDPTRQERDTTDSEDDLLIYCKVR